MPDSERCPTPEARPTAWVLAAPGTGDNAQLRTLVELVDADARWIEAVDPVSRVLRDRMTGFRARAVPGNKAAIYGPPWPDLVLIAGGRAVIDARRIRFASGGRSRIVCLGRPWAPLDWFDLVVTTPQYRLPAAENVICIDLPLNLPPGASSEAVAHWRGELDGLPRPLLGVLLGGDSGSYRFDAKSAAELARCINGVAVERGGSAVVVGSPRTPQKAIERLTRRLEIPARICRWPREAINPYAPVLELADALLVTGDSASMLAEACHSGKPVAMFNLHERARSRLNRKLRAMTPALAPALAKLVARGYWVPARDMTDLHRRAAASGRLSDIGDLFQRSTQAGALDESLDRVRERVLAML